MKTRKSKSKVKPIVNIIKKTKKNPKGAGRKPIMTIELLQKLESGFAIGLTDSEACAYAQIPSSTFYDYCKHHPEFSERKEELKKKPILKAKNTVFNNLHDKETAKWYLERKCKNEFSTKEIKEVTGADGGDLGFIIKIVGVDENNRDN